MVRYFWKFLSHASRPRSGVWVFHPVLKASQQVPLVMKNVVNTETFFSVSSKHIELQYLGALYSFCTVRRLGRRTQTCGRTWTKLKKRRRTNSFTTPKVKPSQGNVRSFREATSRHTDSTSLVLSFGAFPMQIAGAGSASLRFGDERWIGTMLAVVWRCSRGVISKPQNHSDSAYNKRNAST